MYNAASNLTLKGGPIAPFNSKRRFPLPLVSGPEPMTVNKDTDLAVDQAVRLLFADPDWNFKLGIGCLINGAACALLLLNLVLLPVCFCLWSLVLGYLLMTTNAKVKSPDNKLASWLNLLEILIAGGTWIGACAAHFAIFLLVVLGCLAVGELSGLDNVLSPIFLFWAGATWTLIVVAAVLISFLSSFLMVNFSTQQNIAAAFAVKEVVSRWRRQPRQFLAAWLIQVGLIYLAVLIPTLTVLGIFILPSTVFFAQLIGTCIISQAWRAAEFETESN